MRRARSSPRNLGAFRRGTKFSTNVQSFCTDFAALCSNLAEPAALRMDYLQAESKYTVMA